MSTNGKQPVKKRFGLPGAFLSDARGNQKLSMKGSWDLWKTLSSQVQEDWISKSGPPKKGGNRKFDGTFQRCLLGPVTLKRQCPDKTMKQVMKDYNAEKKKAKGCPDPVAFLKKQKCNPSPKIESAFLKRTKKITRYNKKNGIKKAKTSTKKTRETPSKKTSPKELKPQSPTVKLTKPLFKPSNNPTTTKPITTNITPKTLKKPRKTYPNDDDDDKMPDAKDPDYEEKMTKWLSNDEPTIEEKMDEEIVNPKPSNYVPPKLPNIPIEITNKKTFLHYIPYLQELHDSTEQIAFCAGSWLNSSDINNAAYSLNNWHAALSKMNNGPDHRPNSHFIMSTDFSSFLKSIDLKNQQKMEQAYKIFDQRMNQLMTFFPDFKKMNLIVPINFNNTHWSLIVLPSLDCLWGNVRDEKGQLIGVIDDEDENRYSMICHVFDSYYISATHNKKREWRENNDKFIAAFRNFFIKKLGTPSYVGKKNLGWYIDEYDVGYTQPNEWECGHFIIWMMHRIVFDSEMNFAYSNFPWFEIAGIEEWLNIPRWIQDYTHDMVFIVQKTNKLLLDTFEESLLIYDVDCMNYKREIK